MTATVVQTAGSLQSDNHVGAMPPMILPANPTLGNLLIAVIASYDPTDGGGDVVNPAWTPFLIITDDISSLPTTFFYRFVQITDMAILPPLTSVQKNYATRGQAVWEIAGATVNFLDSLLQSGHVFNDQVSGVLSTTDQLQDDELALLWIYCAENGGQNFTLSPGWILDQFFSYPSGAFSGAAMQAMHLNYNLGDTPRAAILFNEHNGFQFAAMLLIKKLLDRTIVTIETSISLPCTPCLTMKTGYVV